MNKANKPVKKNRHELPAIVRAAWAVDFAIRQDKPAAAAIAALEAEVLRIKQQAEDDAYAQAEYEACSDAAWEKHADQKAFDADRDPR